MSSPRSNRRKHETHRSLDLPSATSHDGRQLGGSACSPTKRDSVCSGLTDSYRFERFAGNHPTLGCGGEKAEVRNKKTPARKPPGQNGAPGARIGPSAVETTAARYSRERACPGSCPAGPTPCPGAAQ